MPGAPVNWLAHTYLGGRDPLDRVANLSGDFVLGADLADLDPIIVSGVRIHRAIDVFTDAHPVVRRSRRRVQDGLARFAGPLVDVFFDHFLARSWERFTDDQTPPLRIFVDEVYAALFDHAALLPPRLRAVTPHMVRGDWLASYRSVDGVERILTRMQGRLRRPIALAEGTASLRDGYAGFEADFAAFFPELEAYVARAADAIGGPHEGPAPEGE